MRLAVPLIELCFTPREESITAVRRSVAHYYEALIGDGDAAARIGMTAHELLENAAKYSTDGFACLAVKVDQGTDCVSVTLTNRATRRAQQELKALFDEMDQHPDALTFYQALMTRTGRRRNGSGLGLGRILVEAEMKLSLDLQDDQVVIRAEMELVNKEAA
jgi:two-component sensor histidine kinase